MSPLRDGDRCLAHSRKAKGAADAARAKGGRSKAAKQERAELAAALSFEPPSWSALRTVSEVEAAITYATTSVISGALDPKQGSAAAKLLALALEAAQRRERKRLRAGKRRRPSGPVTGRAALESALTALSTAMAEAATDRGLSPDERREQVGRLAAQLAKAADPSKQLEEMGADLREANRVIEQLRGRRAPQEPSGDTSGAPEEPHH